MLTINLKPTQKKSPVQISFFSSQGREGKHIHPSLPCSSQLPTREQPWSQNRAWWLILTKNVGEWTLNDYLTWSRSAAPWGKPSRTSCILRRICRCLGRLSPLPLAPHCPFLGATAACDSLCVWWSGYHTHGRRVTLSRSSGAVMGGDSSPAARARTSLSSDTASGQRDRHRHSRDLPCPATSAHLHQARGGVTSCQKHLGSWFASSPTPPLWTSSKHRSAGEFLVIVKAGSIKQTQQNRAGTIQRQKLESYLLTHQPVQSQALPVTASYPDMLNVYVAFSTLAAQQGNKEPDDSCS